MRGKRDTNTRTSNAHRRWPSVTPLVGRQLEFKNFDQPICRTVERLYSKQELYVPALSVLSCSIRNFSTAINPHPFSLSLCLSFPLLDTFFSPRGPAGTRKNLEISRRPTGHRGPQARPSPWTGDGEQLGNLPSPSGSRCGKS